jgi:hypothetical protein
MIHIPALLKVISNSLLILLMEVIPDLGSKDRLHRASKVFCRRLNIRRTLTSNLLMVNTLQDQDILPDQAMGINDGFFISDFH